MFRDSEDEVRSISDETDIRRDEESYSSVSIANPSLTEIRAEEGMASRISSYIGGFFNKLPEPFKRPTNYTKVILIGAAAAGNGYLSGNSEIATYILAGVTCLVPIVFDIEHNLSLMQKAYVKINGYEDKRGKKIKETIKKNIYLAEALGLSITGLIVGATTLGGHVKLNEEEEFPASNIVIAAGTFVGGVLQMGVKPLIRKALEKKEIKDIKDKGVDVELIIENNIKEQTQLVRRIKSIPDYSRKKIEEMSIDIGNKLESSNKTHNKNFKDGLRKLKNQFENEKAEVVGEKQKTIEELNTQVTKLQEARQEDRRTINDLEEEKRKLKGTIKEKDKLLSNRNIDFVKTTGRTR